MSNTLKMPEPVAYGIFSEDGSVQSFSDFEMAELLVEYYDGYKSSIHSMYTSEQVKEILEQCAEELETQHYWISKSAASTTVLKIKEMVK